MNILLMVGDHPRHAYIAEQVQSTGHLAGLVIEDRGNHIPDPPDHLGDELTDLYVRHFEKRAEAETSFFSNHNMPEKCPRIEINKSELNSKTVHEFIDQIDPDLTLTYGVHKLSGETLERLPGKKWNIHGGLSPQYRGVITHFWPSYMLEPQMTGVTLHELTKKLDAGPIVHQTAAPLVRGDGIHELACRTVSEFGKELCDVIRLVETGELSQLQPQESGGKLWVSNDWSPHHLKVIYKKFDNKIVDMYLDGELTQSEPDLIRQFD